MERFVGAQGILGAGRRAQVQWMQELQTGVDRRAKVDVDLGGGQADILLSPAIIFGRSHVSWEFVAMYSTACVVNTRVRKGRIW